MALRRMTRKRVRTNAGDGQPFGSPFIEALAEAPELAPLAAARLLARALERTLGWRTRLVPSPANLGTAERIRQVEKVALIRIAPGAGALRIAGDDERTLRLVTRLCANALAGARSHPIEPPRESAGRGRPLVLVVDDDEDAREAIALLLGTDHDVVLAADGAVALSVVRTSAPDAILMDLMMPVMGGMEALERLRADPDTARLPVVLLSGAADDAARVRALELGADFLAKPFSGPELRARLARAMRQASSDRALREEALTDALTALPNRRALDERLAEEVRRARRYRLPLACAMCDVDGLKALNDTCGHAAGDHALRALADLLREELRETDFAARCGGDEFILLLPHTSADEARRLSARISGRLRAPAGGGLGASFGVAALGPDGDGEAMIQAADAALYAAKRAGRNRVHAIA